MLLVYTRLSTGRCQFLPTDECVFIVLLCCALIWASVLCVVHAEHSPSWVSLFTDSTVMLQAARLVLQSSLQRDGLSRTNVLDHDL